MRGRVQAGLVVVVAAAAATFTAVGVGSAASSPRTSTPAKPGVTVFQPLRAAAPLAHTAVTPFIPAGNGDRYLFLKIPGIAGSVDMAGPFSNAIEATGYSWGISNPVNQGGGGGTGKPNLSDLNIQIISDQSAPPLQSAAESGEKFLNITLTAVASEGGGKLAPVRSLVLSNARIDSLQMGGSTGGNDVSTISFSYSRVQSTYYEPDGKSSEVSCYDVSSGTGC